MPELLCNLVVNHLKHETIAKVLSGKTQGVTDLVWACATTLKVSSPPPLEIMLLLDAINTDGARLLVAHDTPRCLASTAWSLWPSCGTQRPSFFCRRRSARRLVRVPRHLVGSGRHGQGRVPRWVAPRPSCLPRSKPGPCRSSSRQNGRAIIGRNYQDRPAALWSAPIHKVSPPWPGRVPNSVTARRPSSTPLTVVAIGWLVATSSNAGITLCSPCVFVRKWCGRCYTTGQYKIDVLS
jgi:hypothetical protein